MKKILVSSFIISILLLGACSEKEKPEVPQEKTPTAAIKTTERPTLNEKPSPVWEDLRSRYGVPSAYHLIDVVEVDGNSHLITSDNNGLVVLWLGPNSFISSVAVIEDIYSSSSPYLSFGKEIERALSRLKDIESLKKPTNFQAKVNDFTLEDELPIHYDIDFNLEQKENTYTLTMKKPEKETITYKKSELLTNTSLTSLSKEMKEVLAESKAILPKLAEKKLLEKTAYKDYYVLKGMIFYNFYLDHYYLTEQIDKTSSKKLYTDYEEYTRSYEVYFDNDGTPFRIHIIDAFGETAADILF